MLLLSFINLAGPLSLHPSLLPEYAEEQLFPDFAEQLFLDYEDSF